MSFFKKNEPVPNFYLYPYGKSAASRTGYCYPYPPSPGSTQQKEYEAKCLRIAQTLLKDESITYEQLDKHLRYSTLMGPGIAKAYYAAKLYEDKSKESLMKWLKEFYK